MILRVLCQTIRYSPPLSQTNIYQRISQSSAPALCRGISASVDRGPFEAEFDREVKPRKSSSSPIDVDNNNQILRGRESQREQEEQINFGNNRRRKILNSLGPGIPNKTDYFEIDTELEGSTGGTNKFKLKQQRVSERFNTDGLDEETSMNRPRSKAFHETNSFYEEFKKTEADLKMKVKSRQIQKRQSMIISRGEIDKKERFGISQKTMGGGRVGVDLSMGAEGMGVTALQSVAAVREEKIAERRRESRNSRSELVDDIKRSDLRRRPARNSETTTPAFGREVIHNRRHNTADQIDQIETDVKEIGTEDIVKRRSESSKSSPNIHQVKHTKFLYDLIEKGSSQTDQISHSETSIEAEDLIPKRNRKALIAHESSSSLDRFDVVDGVPNTGWLMDTPESLNIQNAMLGTRSSQAILRLVELDKTKNFNPLNTSTALVKLAKMDFSGLRKDPRLEILLDRAGEQLREMSISAVTNVLWSITRMKVSPVWLPKLLEQCEKEVNRMTPAQISSCFNSLKRLAFPSPVTNRLKQTLISAISDRLEEFTTTSDFCSLLISLGHFKIQDPDIWRRMAEMFDQRIVEFDINDLSSISWSFARMRKLIDPTIFEHIRQRVECILDSGTAEDLTSLCWSLSITNAATHDFLRFHMTPALKTFLVTFDASKLTRLTWAYANANCADEDLMTEILFSLMPKVQDLMARDIASLCYSFGRLGLGHSEFFSSLACHAIRVSSTFSAPEIPQTVFGFGSAGVRNDEIFRVLWDEASNHLNVYSPNELLDLLSGTTQSRTHQELVVQRAGAAGVLGQIDCPLIELPPQTLSHVSRCVDLLCGKVKDLSVKRSIALLKSLSVLHEASELHVSVVRELANETAENIYQQAHLTWKISPDMTLILLRSLCTLRLSNTKLLEDLFSHTAAVLKTPMMNLGGLCEFLRACRCHEPDLPSFRLFLSHLHRRLPVQIAVNDILRKHPPIKADAMSDQVGALALLGSLGLDEIFTQRRHQNVIENLDRMNNPQLGILDLSKLLVAQTQIGTSSEWTRSALTSFTSKRYSNSYENDEMDGITACASKVLGGLEETLVSVLTEIRQLNGKSDNVIMGLVRSEKIPLKKEEKATMKIRQEFGDAFVGLAWVSLSCGTELSKKYVQLLLEDAVSCFSGNALPSNLLLAQQVCLCLNGLWSTQSGSSVEMGDPILSNGSRHQPSERLREFVTDVLECRRSDFAENPGKVSLKRLKETMADEKQARMSRFKLGDFAYTAWLSDTLTKEMKIRHVAHHVIGNIYSVPIAFPQIRHVVDVYGFSDLSVPNATPLRTALIRKQQLSELEMASNESSAQERLAEELGLLPGRISRYFFLLATLDAQASQIRVDLQHTRVQLLGNLSTTSHNAEPVSATLNPPSSSSSQLSALRELHLAQRQLLADKLFVDKKASEWLARAKNVVNRYSQESRRRFRPSDRLNSPRLDSHRSSLPNGSTPDSRAECRQRTRLSGTSLDDHEYAVPGVSSPYISYGLRGPESGTSIVGGNPKRRRTSNDFIAPGRPPHRRSARKLSIPVEKTKQDCYQSPVPTIRNFTIKLGSQQKGRPRKSTTKEVVEYDAVAVQEEMLKAEEYFCPICGKSDYEDPAMVACDACDTWYHCICVGFENVADAESSKNFYCSICRQSRSEAAMPDPDDSDGF